MLAETENRCAACREASIVGPPGRRRCRRCPEAPACILLSKLAGKGSDLGDERLDGLGDGCSDEGEFRWRVVLVPRGQRVVIDQLGFGHGDTAVETDGSERLLDQRDDNARTVIQRCPPSGLAGA